MISTNRLTQTAFFIALCVVLGYLFLPVPNVEMITLGIFLGGLYLGAGAGLAVGILSELIFSMGNPMGFPPPPLLLAQVLSTALTGLSGGLLRGWLRQRNFFSRLSIPNHLILALIGVILTLVYDLLTNLSFPLTAGFSAEQIRIALYAGIPFALVHVAVNAFSFAVLAPAVLLRLPAWRT